MIRVGKAVVGTCDFAGCTFIGDVHPVHLIVEQQEWTADLCDEHLSPLLDTMKGTAKRRKREGRDRVWTIDEIENLKKSR